MINHSLTIDNWRKSPKTSPVVPNKLEALWAAGHWIQEPSILLEAHVSSLAGRDSFCNRIVGILQSSGNHELSTFQMPRPDMPWSRCTFWRNTLWIRQLGIKKHWQFLYSTTGWLHMIRCFACHFWMVSTLSSHHMRTPWTYQDNTLSLKGLSTEQYWMHQGIKIISTLRIYIYLYIPIHIQILYICNLHI